MPRASAAEAAETARRILQVATTHFAERGFAAASVDDIAHAAGLTRGAVYHHYASKPGLFRAVAAAQQQLIAEAIVEATADADAPSSLRAGSHAYLDAITAGPAARLLLVDGPAVLSWEDWRRLDAEGPVAELILGLTEAGVSAPLRAPLAAALSGAMNDLALWLSQHSDAAARTHAHEALDRVLTAALSPA